MGKTAKPLKIVLFPPCDQWVEFAAMEDKGHAIIRLGTNLCTDEDLINADVILGKNCWRMDEDHRDYAALAIKEARMKRYHSKGPEFVQDAKLRAEASDELEEAGLEVKNG